MSRRPASIACPHRDFQPNAGRSAVAARDRAPVACWHAQYATLMCQHRVRSRPCRAPTQGDCHDCDHSLPLPPAPDRRGDRLDARPRAGAAACRCPAHARHRHDRRSGAAGQFRPPALRQSGRAQGRQDHLWRRRHLRQPQSVHRPGRLHLGARPVRPGVRQAGLRIPARAQRRRALHALRQPRRDGGDAARPLLGRVHPQSARRSSPTARRSPSTT